MGRKADLTYRYTLRRYVGPDTRTLLWVMLNPSTADEQKDDPTIRKVKGFTERAGFGRVSVVNLFAKRATYPKDLFAGDVDPTGPENGLTLFREIQAADAVVLAWGSFYASLPVHRKVARPNIEAMVRKQRKPMYCIGRTKDGHPRHPLMVGYNQPLIPWED